MGVGVKEKCPNCQETVYMPINCPQIAARVARKQISSTAEGKKRKVH